MHDRQLRGPKALFVDVPALTTTFRAKPSLWLRHRDGPAFSLLRKEKGWPILSGPAARPVLGRPLSSAQL